MKIYCIILFLFSANVHADVCMKESKLFFDLVAVKWGVSSNMNEKPEKYNDEKWEYIYSGGQKIFKKGRVSEEKSIKISKIIATNDFSNNPEVEVNIFEDYWLLSCRNLKKEIESTPLSNIPKGALLECWGSVSSRKEFQACLGPLLLVGKL